MNIISADQFNQQITSGSNKTHKIYQDRILIQGPVFALDQKKSALQYCQAYINKNPQNLCLLVQEEYYFQLWKEDGLIQDKKNIRSLPLSKNTNTFFIKNDDLSLNEKKPLNIKTEILLDFVYLCQHLLSQSIGPIGVVICKKVSAQNPEITCQEFIEILAQKIPDSQHSQQFKKTLLQFIENNIGFTMLLKEMSEQLQNNSREIDIINTIDLEKIVTQMCSSKGIQIKNRRYNLKTYSNCFVGSEAVDWMINNLNLSSEQAIKLGQRLMDENLVNHVLKEQQFENKYLFYRFSQNKAK